MRMPITMIRKVMLAHDCLLFSKNHPEIYAEENRILAIASNFSFAIRSLLQLQPQFYRVLRSLSLVGYPLFFVILRDACSMLLILQKE